MMSTTFQSIERASRFWRLDPHAEASKEGPIWMIRDIGGLVFRHKLKLLVCTLAGLALASFYANILPKTYSATATLLLEPRQIGVPGQDIGALQGLDLNRADSELQIIRSERLLSAIFDGLDLKNAPEFGPQTESTTLSYINSSVRTVRDWATRIEGIQTGSVSAKVDMQLPEKSARPDPTQDEAYRAAFAKFAEHLTVRRVGQSYVIEIEYSSVDPALPARVANAAVAGYIMQAVSFKAQMIRAGSEPLQGRLDALSVQVDAATSAMRLGMLPLVPTPDADARVIGAALPPLAPSGPRVKLIIFLGGIIGFLFGSALIVLAFGRDRKVLNAQELTRQTGVPCIGAIPDLKDRHKSSRRHLRRQNEYVVAVRDLRTSIEIACSTVRTDRGIVVGVVGWGENRNGRTLSAKLAQLIRRSGRQVTLFQSYAEKPAYAESPGAEKDATNLRANSLAELAGLGLDADTPVFQNMDGVDVLAIYSTDKRSNLFADFRNSSIATAVEAARLKGDVIFDLPALNGSKDALALATYADVILVVASLGKSSINEVNASLQQLRQARTKVIGTVVTGVQS